MVATPINSKFTLDRLQFREGRIQIVSYKPSWELEFQEIARELREVIGAHAERIDHIGSTAVPDLAAKDVIDVQITVPNLASSKLVELLGAIGYVNIDDASDNLIGLPVGSKDLVKRFLLQPEGRRRTHLHIRESGRINQRYPLLFRDYLRTNDRVGNAYQQIKVELAERFSHDSESDYSVKDPYMDTVYLDEWKI